MPNGVKLVRPPAAAQGEIAALPKYPTRASFDGQDARSVFERNRHISDTEVYRWRPCSKLSLVAHDLGLPFISRYGSLDYQ